MLVNISYNEPEIKNRIEEAVGKVFTLNQRWKLGGIGSPKLSISSCSIEIHNLLILDHNSNTCNIEIRPKGIIVRFRSLLETYALVIPFYKLQLYKGKAREYGIYAAHHFIKVHVNTKGEHQFMKKIMAQKVAVSPPDISDL